MSSSSIPSLSTASPAIRCRRYMYRLPHFGQFWSQGVRTSRPLGLFCVLIVWGCRAVIDLVRSAILQVATDADLTILSFP